ncbi:uncharacterized protein LOC123053648 [Triticum aestivum]|uniref:uncharacterized protein LOC123053648 n=1 Tax=Triticum aestivum TaxID=4565 RepID=UPI001D003B76|nr:uncharacterized protein LOC123053648 [Triticum aestivum]
MKQLAVSLSGLFSFGLFSSVFFHVISHHRLVGLFSFAQAPARKGFHALQGRSGGGGGSGSSRQSYARRMVVAAAASGHHPVRVVVRKHQPDGSGHRSRMSRVRPRRAKASPKPKPETPANRTRQPPVLAISRLWPCRLVRQHREEAAKNLQVDFRTTTAKVFMKTAGLLKRNKQFLSSLH